MFTGPAITDDRQLLYASDRYYLMMELLRGENLRQRLRTGGLTVEQALGVVTQCAAALAACHEHGIIHRDLKPENIFIVDKPRDRLFVKILDFGIAKLTHPVLRAVVTQDGEILGTAWYMSRSRSRRVPTSMVARMSTRSASSCTSC